MIKLIIIFFKFIKRSFSPSYIYTLDKSFICENQNTWVFKEFGTHTYIIKTWEQLQKGNFIRGLNPVDISYICQFEARKKMEGTRLRISEEKRGGVYVLSCDDIKISVTAKDFLKNYALVSQTDNYDIVKIAYYAGVKKGRAISSCRPDKKPHDKPDRSIFTIVK